MAEYQRQQEASESAAKRSRIATDFNRGIAKHITALEIVDPNDLDGGVITVARQTRNDPLGGLHARKSVDEAQYQAGRAFQHDFETAERGPRAIDPSKEAVDGGRMPEPITDHQRAAVVRLGKADRELGQHGAWLTRNVLIHGMTIEQIGLSRGTIKELELKYLGRRFRECLDCLALVYGFSNGRR